MLPAQSRIGELSSREINHHREFMSINPIQFQKGLSLANSLQAYGREEQCEAAGERLAGPTVSLPVLPARSGVAVPAPQGCVTGSAAAVGTRPVCEGTLMEYSRSLTQWFPGDVSDHAVETNIAALALMRQLGISWRAAWLLR